MARIGAHRLLVIVATMLALALVVALVARSTLFVRRSSPPTVHGHQNRAAPVQGITLDINSHGTTPRPASTKSPGKATATPGANEWTLIYSDDFNGTRLAPAWGVYNGPHGGGKSYYSPQEVQVQGGMLQLRMEQKTTGGLPYTTGGAALFGLAQVYGKYEFRVKLPRGKGVGPYAILWPKVAAPNSMQVDIFESPPPDKTTLYFTNHAINGTSTQLQARGQFADGFHVITCEWTPGGLQMLVDGVSQGTLTSGVPAQAMWFGLAVESGDAFVGLPDGSTVLPVAMQVDWVHIYKYNG